VHSELHEAARASTPRRARPAGLGNERAATIARTAATMPNPPPNLGRCCFDTSTWYRGVGESPCAIRLSRGARCMPKDKDCPCRIAQRPLHGRVMRQSA